MQNRRYESKFDVIISNQPYWSHNGFLSVQKNLLSFSMPGRDRKIAGLLFARGVRIHTDTMHYENYTKMSFFVGSELDLNILTLKISI